MSHSDAVSAAELVARHYEELRALAHALMRRERPGHTLDTTGLVNEAYLRLAGQAGQAGLDEHQRSQFFAIVTNTMRRILVDHARGRGRQKRGGGAGTVPLDDVPALLSDEEAEELIALDDAMARLAQVNPRGAEVVEYRFFGGFTLEETAQLLGVSAKTVQRDWLAARAWLRKEVAGDLGLPA